MDSYFENFEAEATLIGTIFADPNSFWRANHVKESDFSEPLLGRIYRDMVNISETGRVIAPIEFNNRLKADKEVREWLKEGKLDSAKNLVAGLMAKAISITDPKDLADTIIRCAQLRRIKLTCESALASLMPVDGNIKDNSELVADICKDLENSICQTSEAEIEQDDKIIEMLYENCKLDLPVYSTGLQILDAAMGGGLVQGKAYGFAAPKKSGKTALLATIAENLNLKGVKTLYVALEMGSSQIMERIAARRMKINPVAFLNPMDREKLEFQQKVLNAKSGGNLFFLNQAGMTFNNLKSKLLRAVRRGGYKVVIIDYWQLIGGKDGKTSMAEHLDNVAQWIAEFSKKYGVVTITASQINQEGNTRGGEGMRLAFDQVYKMNRVETIGAKNETIIESWFEMMDTRYTKWMDLGEENNPAFRINPNGVFFEEKKNG
jgi:replicative DNA helicase